MSANEKGIRAEIVGCDLHRAANAIANVFDEIVSRPVIPLPDLMREHQFCVSVDARPQPEIAFALLWLNHAASMTTDVLPLLIEFNSAAWQITEIPVHVTRERFARFTNEA